MHKKRKKGPAGKNIPQVGQFLFPNLGHFSKIFEKGQGRPTPSPSLVTRLNGLSGKRDSRNMIIS